MTEIPEHLLKRSKAAKSGSAASGDDSGGGATSSAAVEPSAAAPAAAPAGPPALIIAATNMTPDKPTPPAAPDAPYVTAAKTRKRMPIWAMGLVAALPVWAISYAGTMQQPEVEDPLFIDAAEAYNTCAGCHGASGGGGTGYQLSDGQVVATFPDANDHLVHIARGSAAISGQAYGSPERPGGQRIAGDRGVMPAHLTKSQLELELVVFHERAVLSGEDTTTDYYSNWIESLRHRIESNDEHGIELDAILACADPAVTPGATGSGIDCIGAEAAEE